MGSKVMPAGLELWEVGGWGGRRSSPHGPEVRGEPGRGSVCILKAWTHGRQGRILRAGEGLGQRWGRRRGCQGPALGAGAQGREPWGKGRLG